MVARPLAVGADGRMGSTALRALAQELRVLETPGASRLLVADDSLANPWLCHPLQMGFDVAVEDLRPWLGVDACALVARGDGALARALALEEAGGMRSGGLHADGRGGACGGRALLSDETACALAAERLRTTSLCVQRRCDTAQVVAHFLAVHPSVAWVSYPGLPDDPANDAARRVLEHGFGAYLTFGLVASAVDLTASEVLARATDAGLLAEPPAVPGAHADGGAPQAALSPRWGLAAASGCSPLTTLMALPLRGEAGELGGTAPEAPDDTSGAAPGGRIFLLCAGLETPLDVVAALEACLRTPNQ